LSTAGLASGAGGVAVMKATQILKVYNRLKYIGVQYGERLDAYLELIGQVFPDSEDDLEEIEKIKIIEKGRRGKISRFRVVAKIFKPFSWKIYAYLAIFFINIGLQCYISSVKKQ
jgi:hypothetical protein